MKKTMLWSALFTVICTSAYADTQPAVQPQSTPTPENNASTINPTVTPVTTQTTTTTQSVTVQPMPAQVINCDYKISADTKDIDTNLVLTWSEKAVVQAFEFDPATLDNQIQKLHTCFTEEGWTSFNTALQKSGNLEAIQTQKLTVSSMVDGQAQLLEVKNNQWKISLPLQVVYQNEKEKVTQLLNVNLTIARKPTGDLGINQMIASPRSTVGLQNDNTNGTQIPVSNTNQPTPVPTTSGAPTTPNNSSAAPTPSPTNTGAPTIPNNSATPPTSTLPVEQKNPSLDSTNTIQGSD